MKLEINYLPSGVNPGKNGNYKSPRQNGPGDEPGPEQGQPIHVALGAKVFAPMRSL